MAINAMLIYIDYLINFKKDKLFSKEDSLSAPIIKGDFAIHHKLIKSVIIKSGIYSLTRLSGKNI